MKRKIDKEVKASIKSLREEIKNRFSSSKTEEIRLAKLNATYHRKLMEYYLDEIKILEGK